MDASLLDMRFINLVYGATSTTAFNILVFLDTEVKISDMRTSYLGALSCDFLAFVSFQ